MQKIIDKRVTLAIFTFFTLLFIAVLILVNIKYDQQKKEYFQNLYKHKKSLYDNEIKFINKQTDLVKDLVIDKKVLEIMNSAYGDFNAAREELIKYFMPKYKVLSKYGMKIVHFHLLNGISFVRFHNLDLYGDSLLKYRPSVEYVQQYKRHYHGFEIGKVKSVYRNVYPLFYNGKLIGSFEISFDIKKFISDIFKNDKILILYKKNIVDSKLITKKNPFKTCRLNPNYYVNSESNLTLKKNYNFDFTKKIILLKRFVIFAYPFKNGYLISISNYANLKKYNLIVNNYKNKILLIVIIYLVAVVGLLALYVFCDMKRQSEYDQLTNVLNRHGCFSKLRKIRNEDYSVMIMDIDHFKKINDTYGHDVGDEILKQLAEYVSKNIRKDDVFCRWGGEEFIVIMPHTNLNEAKIAAEKVRKIIEHSKFIKNIPVTVSIGVAKSVGDFDKTLKVADENLYKAKNSGRNQVVG